MSWSEREEDLVQEAVDLIWREHGRVNGTPCYEAALRMLQCSRAAEERGRRRGVEEIREIVANAMTTWPGSWDGLNFVLQRLKDLAPRDSAPAKPVCATCGKADGHWPSCPNAPRDSGKED